MEIQSISPAELLKQHKQDMIRRRKSRQSALPSLESPQNPKDVTPKLARGGSMDGFISLDMSKKAKPVSSTELAKVSGQDFYVNFVLVVFINRCSNEWKSLVARLLATILEKNVFSIPHTMSFRWYMYNVF